MKKFGALLGIGLVTVFGSAAQASENITAGDRVLDQGSAGDYSAGTVLAVFGGIRAKVNWDLVIDGKNIGTVTNVPVVELQKKVRCSENVCEGNRVLASGCTGEEFEGTVLEVFSGGIARVNWDLVVEGKNIGSETFVPVDTLLKKSQ